MIELNHFAEWQSLNCRTEVGRQKLYSAHAWTNGRELHESWLLHVLNFSSTRTLDGKSRRARYKKIECFPQFPPPAVKPHISFKDLLRSHRPTVSITSKTDEGIEVRLGLDFSDSASVWVATGVRTSTEPDGPWEFYLQCYRFAN